MSRRPVILDVDTGVDDALALLLAVRHPDLDVLGVTCVHGNQAIDAVVDATLRVLDAAGAPVDLAVARGFALPLVEPTHYCPQIHGDDGIGDLNPPLPASLRSVVPDHAVDYLRAVLTASETPVTIIALAPLTNIAGLIRLDAALCQEKVERVVWMGGSAFSGGNASAWAEANAAYDPEAAHIVLTSGLPITMYGLDAYLKVDFSTQELVELGAVEQDADAPDTARARASRSTGCQTAARLLLRDMAHFEMSTAQIGDAGAVAAFIMPEGAQVRQMHVAVELTGGRTRGMTVCDSREFVSPPDQPQLPSNVDVVVSVTPSVLKKVFSDAVLDR